MADISAKLVNDLRNKTGLGMMECKKALVESGGDVEKAFDNLRKKGVKTSITERAATEGRVVVLVAPDHKKGVLVEVNCNTDFAAKSEIVGKIANAAANRLMSNANANLAEDAEIKQDLVSAAQQTGENIVIGRTSVLSTEAGYIGSFLYSVAGKGKSGVLIALTGAHDEEIVRNLGMHIVAARPVAATRAEVPPELVAKEKEIAVEQAKASGKPQAIAEKIAEGKMNSFYSERVLVDQEFINAEAYKGTVASLLKSKGATLEKYVRIEVGH